MELTAGRLARAMPPLANIDQRKLDFEIMDASIRRLPGPLQILEAGCGKSWPLKLAGVDYRLTGIDLDAVALRLRVKGVGDLHEAIVGDLCAPGAIPAGRFDVVYSSFVLEHIEAAEQAFKAMVDGLRPGGLLILRIPDRYSVFGWTTRVTPHFVHVAYYRHVLRHRNAGKPGHAPYPTVHSRVVCRQGIQDLVERCGCKVIHEYAHAYYWREGRARRAIHVYARLLHALSLGTLAWRHNNLTYVIRKND